MASFRVLTLLALSVISILTALADSPPDLIVTCFNCGDGVKRVDAAVAASKFCIEHWGEELFQYNPSDEYGFVFDYYWSDGTIELSFAPFWGELGCTFDFNIFFLNETDCYYAFMAPIDYCDTDGVNGKHGGYYWTQCGNVTINPNPNGADDCPNSSPNWSPPGVKVLSYHASDEEHAATAAALANFEKSPAQDADLKAALSQIKRDSDPGEDKSIANIDKRDTYTECFDRCWGVDRDIAQDAVGWFCAQYSYHELDIRPSDDTTFDDNGPPCVSANYTYTPDTMYFWCWPKDPIINMALGLRLLQDSPDDCKRLDQRYVIDYYSCKQGLMSAVDSCNTDTTTSKQGGIHYDGCLQYTFDSHPSTCDDECSYNGEPPS